MSSVILAIRKKFGVETEIRSLQQAAGYFVSEDGRVFSDVPCSRTKERPRECRPITTAHGYKMFRMYVQGRSTADYVHRLVAAAFLLPPLPGQTIVRHLDGDPANNNAANLAWGTQAENMRDMVSHGRSLKGIKNATAKLTDGIVAAARILAAEGFGYNAMGTFFGVDGETIRRAVTGEQWRHVDAV